jgi:hypothetical protein
MELTVEKIINNVKSELNTRLTEYESKIEEYKILLESFPKYEPYRGWKEIYEIKREEVESILRQLNEYAW